MQKKWLLAIPLILILILICVAMVAVSLFSFSTARVSGINLLNGGNMQFSVDETEERSFPVSGDAQLRVDDFYGNIQVKRGTGDAIVVETHKEARGFTEQDARDNLEKVTVNFAQNGNALDVRVVLRNGQLDWVGKVDFVIEVPEKTQVTLHTDHGDIHLEGTDGVVDLSTDFGTVEVRDVKGGALTIATESGRIEVNNAQSGSSDVNVTSQFGEIILSDVAGGAVTVQSRNGALMLTNITAEEHASLTSDFGDVKLDGGGADSLEAKTQNGHVSLTEVDVNGKLLASSDFGSVRVTKCEAGEVDLESLNGGLYLDGAKGKIRAHTNFGDVEIKNASEALLDLESKNGKLQFEGSPGSGPHKLTSDFGDIILRLPADQALDIDLKTDFGDIETEFDVNMSGSVEKEHWTGKINGGGGLLTVTTGNGGITLEIAR